MKLEEELDEIILGCWDGDISFMSGAESQNA